MKNINREIEIKFELKNPESIRKELKNQSARFLGKAFERTIRFDTKDKKLEKEDKFLRVRTGFKNTITFKRKLKKEDKKFREREEIEIEISDPKKMETILNKLGFTKKWIMEKYREKWEWGSAEIVIDKLPFGNFIEIEGNENSILKTIKMLRLSLKEGITATYWGLWENYCRKKGIKNENIIFRK
jgi:adenylate cyclase class 2